MELLAPPSRGLVAAFQLLGRHAARIYWRRHKHALVADLNHLLHKEWHLFVDSSAALSRYIPNEDETAVSAHEYVVQHGGVARSPVTFVLSLTNVSADRVTVQQILAEVLHRDVAYAVAADCDPAGANPIPQLYLDLDEELPVARGALVGEATGELLDRTDDYFARFSHDVEPGATEVFSAQAAVVAGRVQWRLHVEYLQAGRRRRMGVGEEDFVVSAQPRGGCKEDWNWAWYEGRPTQFRASPAEATSTTNRGFTDLSEPESQRGPARSGREMGAQICASASDQHGPTGSWS